MSFSYQTAIHINRTALLRIVVEMLVLVEAGLIDHKRSLIIARIIRCAESAVRRLIVLFERHNGIRLVKPGTRQLPDFTRLAARKADRLPAFALIDPRKRFDLGGFKQTCAKSEPRIWVLGMNRQPIPEKPEHREIASTSALKRKLKVLEHALGHLPQQARRLKRLLEKRKDAPPGPGCVGPIRPGLPPGYRKRPIHAIDDVLLECHGLVVNEIYRPDKARHY